MIRTPLCIRDYRIDDAWNVYVLDFYISGMKDMIYPTPLTVDIAGWRLSWNGLKSTMECEFKRFREIEHVEIPKYEGGWR